MFPVKYRTPLMEFYFVLGGAVRETIEEILTWAGLPWVKPASKALGMGTFCFGYLTGDTFFSKTIRLFFATALACEGTTEGENSHSLLTWLTAKLFLI